MIDAQSEAWMQPQEPKLEVVYEAECSSLTGRSMLTYQVGTDTEDAEAKLQLRISRNSGGGMFCKDWAPVERIDAILAKFDPLTARTFNDVHPGKSINTGGFILAILKDLGVLQAKDENTRHHEHVAGSTVLQALAVRIAESGSPKGARKKAE